MTIPEPNTKSNKTKFSMLPNWPFAVWMIALTLALALLGGLSAPEIIHVFNSGWGQVLGEFALILLPSFTMAAAISWHNIGTAKKMAVTASPIVAAGMVCPDTAYAALSPVAGNQRLSVAFGSYAGFKLLYPAGPLIVATGLGIDDSSLLLYGVAFLIPIWAIGLLWAKGFSTSLAVSSSTKTTHHSKASFIILSPFVMLASLLIIGALIDFSAFTLLDFATRPKGALIAAAIVALLSVPSQHRRACLDNAVRKTGALLVIIGAASAFGAIFTALLPIDNLAQEYSGYYGIIGLFVLTAGFKLAQGSSMATFAAIAPIAAPIVASADIPAAAAVFAICFGSFISILPNDSFYWLVRRDALNKTTEARSVAVLAGGALLQGLSGLALIFVAMAMGLI